MMFSKKALNQEIESLKLTISNLEEAHKQALQMYKKANNEITGLYKEIRTLKEQLAEAETTAFGKMLQAATDLGVANKKIQLLCDWVQSKTSTKD
jgi:predicted  nucleic acid-binding Zn-ribbon protein